MPADRTNPAPTLQHELGKRRPFEVPEQEAFLNLTRTQTVLAGAFDHLFERHGISASAFNVLRILRGAHRARVRHGRPCHEIGAQMVARVPDVTRLVDRLEKAGLAQRHRCSEDRRVVYVAITQPGLDLLAKLDKPTVELHRAQLGHLSRRELEQLNRLLVRARTPAVSRPAAVTTTTATATAGRSRPGQAAKSGREAAGQ